MRYDNLGAVSVVPKAMVKGFIGATTTDIGIYLADTHMRTARITRSDDTPEVKITGIAYARFGHVGIVAGRMFPGIRAVIETKTIAHNRATCYSGHVKDISVGPDNIPAIKTV